MGGSFKNGASQDYKIFTYDCLEDSIVSGTAKIIHYRTYIVKQ